MDSHNERQKALLRRRPMFASLLRGFGHVLGFSPEFMERIDFENIELVGTEFITAEMRERRADLVWKVPLLALPGEVGPPLPPCFVLTELQSGPEADMLLRLKEYTLLVEQASQRAEAGRTHSGSKHPAVIPTVLHTGEGPWTAPTDHISWHGTGLFETSIGNSRYHVFDIHSYPLDKLPENELASCWIRLERATTVQEMHDAVTDAFRLVPEPEYEELRRTLWRQWMGSLLWRGDWRAEDGSGTAPGIRKCEVGDQYAARCNGAGRGRAVCVAGRKPRAIHAPTARNASMRCAWSMSARDARSPSPLRARQLPPPNLLSARPAPRAPFPSTG